MRKPEGTLTTFWSLVINTLLDTEIYLHLYFFMLWAAGLFLGGLFIRFYDLLDQTVAHNVLLGQAHLGNALNIAQDMQRVDQTGPYPANRSGSRRR